MNYLLNIHTTLEKAIVNVSNGPEVICTSVNSNALQHAAFLHTSINEILQQNDILPSALKGVGVTAGPGSYTGIRVGLATAKGLCFALQIPMMMINTLELMAYEAIENVSNKNGLFCPMIDARRMEVFTAVYNVALNEVKPPSAMVLEENSFSDLSQEHPVYFFGSGSSKFEKIINYSANQKFIQADITSSSFASFSWNKYQKNQFDNIGYSNAFYVKEFHSNTKTA